MFLPSFLVTSACLLFTHEMFTAVKWLTWILTFLYSTFVSMLCCQTCTVEVFEWKTVL